MATLRCMCIFRYSKNIFLFSPKYNLLSSAVLLGHSKTNVTFQKMQTCFYSTSKDSTSTKSIIDDILKSKVSADRSSLTEAKTNNEKSKSDHQEKAKKDAFAKKAMKYTLIAFGTIFTGLTVFLTAEWGAPKLDETGQPIQDEYSHFPTWKAYLWRAKKELTYYEKMIKEPSSNKLLPEPLTEPYIQPPYTLVIEMTGVLVHPDWTYKTGWRFKKRPGVDFFLQQVGPPLFEVVIYTSEQGFTAFPIIDSLDPNGYIMYRLFRDATRYMNGHHVKDLACLNRDLSKVIIVDWNAKSYQLQPENALHLKKWTGSSEDRTLIDLAAFLGTIATSNVDDVRPVLAYYSKEENPLETFKENQKKYQDEQEKLAKSQMERIKQPNLTKSWGSSFFNRRTT